MELEDFIKNFAELFDETAPSEITSNTDFTELDEWGSMTVASIMVFIKQKYAKTITADQIRSCDTVGDLFALVQEL